MFKVFKTFVALFPLLGLLLAGCNKSMPGDSNSFQPPTATVPNPKAATVSRLHWPGKKWLAAQTNATPFMGIWKLPESAKLETQTLDKLSTAPWRLLRGETNAANTASKLLRPLLDDLVQEESYVELRHAISQPAETVLAIRLNGARGALWSTNLAAVLESLTAIRPAPSASGRSGWVLKKHHAPNLIELARVGEWTVVGSAQGTNTLFRDMLVRLQRDHAPSSAPSGNLWLEADLDLARVIEMFSGAWKPPQNLPRMTVKVTGDGGNVRAEGELNFPKPLPFEIEPWNIPTNLAGGYLMGFTAIQGIRHSLSNFESSHNLQFGVPPNQAYMWSLFGLPAQAYFAAPLADASNQVHQLAGRLMEFVNPSLAASDNGKIGWVDELNGASWQGMPWLSPFIRAVRTNNGDFVFGGTLPVMAPTDPVSPELLKSILSRTNLVYYDWEITGPRIETWMFVGQLMRMVFGKPQVPLDSASIAWLLMAKDKLGNGSTLVTKTGPATLSYVRKSAVGFTSIELHLLADWLESPQFPRGLHTFLASTNAPSGVAAPPAAAPAKP
jgi:hypothetical protein